MNVSQERQWFKFWPEGLPYSLHYHEIPLFEFLSNSAEKYPDNIAFSVKENKLTYKELDILTTKLANGLTSLGTKRGDNILLLLPNSLDFVVGYYGILKAGGTVVPANPLYKARELRHQLNDTQAVAMITNADGELVVREIRNETGLKAVILADAKGSDRTILLSEILAKSSSVPLALNTKSKEDVAAIEYTGGTTGLPKGVMLTHYNLVSNAMQNAAWFGWDRTDIVLGVLPFYHSWGACACINSPIYCGARVIVFPRFDTEELLTTIEKEKATVLYGAASMFIMLVNSPLLRKYDLSSLRYVKAGAMPIPAEIRDKWEQLSGVKMVLGYGLSEASPETHNSPLQRVKPGTIGIPVFDTDAKIMDADTGETELPIGKTGELIIKGPQVMKGYWNRPDDNRETLRNGWLYTGDLAFMDEEGYFHIADRKKETIKYKGYTIAPSEIEAILYEHPAVKECAVVGKPDALSGEIVKAYVVVKDGYSLGATELIEFCEQKVSPYKKIREVEFIEEIPRTAVGKTLRRVLKERG